MKYNLTKLQIFLAIKVCERKKIPATSQQIADYLDKNVQPISYLLLRYTDLKYLSRRQKRFKDKRRCYVYRILSKGESVFEKLSERYNEGSHLNLRVKSTPIDYSDYVLLPGLQKEVEA